MKTLEDNAMTPERLKKLTKMVMSSNVRVDWENRRLIFLKDPPKEAMGDIRRVLVPRDGSNVVDLKVERGTAFKVNGSMIVRMEKGRAVTNPVEVRWVEAEGYVLLAWSPEPLGYFVAESLIGKPVPPEE